MEKHAFKPGDQVKYLGKAKNTVPLYSKDDLLEITEIYPQPWKGIPVYNCTRLSDEVTQYVCEDGLVYMGPKRTPEEQYAHQIALYQEAVTAVDKYMSNIKRAAFYIIKNEWPDALIINTRFLEAGVAVDVIREGSDSIITIPKSRIIEDEEFLKDL